MVRDYELLGYTYQSELVECAFESCIFQNVRVEADLSISGGSIADSQVTKLLGVMNIILGVDFKEDKLEDIVVDVAVISNKMNNVRINNLKRLGDCVNRDNKYTNSYIDNKLVE